MTATATKHRVLVVDDNREAATSMAEILNLVGFDVETCFDGPSALKAVERFTPDACLLDINMPGMDGYDLARHLRERFPERPPLFATMTAQGDDTHLERAVGAGFDLQFTKPAAPQDVIEQLKEGIAERMATRPATDTPLQTPATGAPARHSALHRLLTRLTGMWTKPEADGR